MSGQLPTPPSTKSSSSRSRAMNSSEESQAVPLVTIDTTDIFRSGAPNPLPALPLQSEMVESNSQAYAPYLSLQPSITSSLRDARVGSFTMELTHRFIRGESPTKNDITILLILEKDPQRDNLTVAVNEVLNILFQAQIHYVRVEALDPRANRRFWVPTVSQVFITTMWGILKRDIIDILGKTNNIWSSFTVLNRGRQEADSEPVVSIGVRKMASFEWKIHVRSKILDLLEEARLDFDVVFVREDMPSAEVALPLARPLSEFSGPVIVGSSLGMNDNSGTLGGYFTLENKKGQKKIFGVTNHHVVFSDDIIKKAEEGGKSDMELLGVKKPGQFPWQVDSPSLADKEKTLKIWDGDIEDDTRELLGSDEVGSGIRGQQPVEGLETLLERATMEEGDTTKLEAEIQRVKQHREARMRARDELQVRNDLKFASVFATSGRAQFGERDKEGQLRGMDWALLECLQSRLGDNTLPESKTFDMHVGGGLGGRGVREATKFKYRTRYFTYGRSGHHIGILSSNEVVVNLVDDPEPYVAKVIVNGEDGFMTQGDSGCWVLNSKGQLEGLGFGASPENFSGYVIPIQDVYEDIEKRVGAKIVDPEMVNLEGQ